MDVRYGARMLRKNAGFTLVAVASLALGIGATAAIVSAFDVMFRRELPVEHIDRLVTLRVSPPGNPMLLDNPSLFEYGVWKARSQSFDVMGVSMGGRRDFQADDGDAVEWVEGQLFSPDMLAALGVQPQTGRLFTEQDRGSPGILISHRLWQRRFGGDPDVLHRTVRLNGARMPIVGVMPPHFRYPVQVADYWAPFFVEPPPSPSQPRLFGVIARLQPDVTIDQAQTELEAIGRALDAELPAHHRGWRARVLPLREAWYGWTAQPLLTLQLAVVLVLAMACANVTGLLLARYSARRHELATRLALGAQPGRIVRQWLAESLLLSLAGGAAGLVVAGLTLQAIARATPPIGRPPLSVLALDWSTVALIAFLSIAVGVIIGVVPLATLRLPLDTRGLPRHDHQRPQRVREVLVTAQVAMAVVLLVGFGLLGNSFVRLVGRDLNVEPEGLVAVEYRIPTLDFIRRLGTVDGIQHFAVVGNPAERIERIQARLRLLPGVQSVGGISHPPLNFIVAPETLFAIGAQPRDRLEARRWGRRAAHFLVSAEFFSSIGAPPTAGREFSSADESGSPWVAVINESLARRFWPHQSPLGQELTLLKGDGERPRTIVGIVPDIPIRFDEIEPTPVIYVSYLQQPVEHVSDDLPMYGQMTFAIRSHRHAPELLDDARRAVAELDPVHPLRAIDIPGELANLETRRNYLLGFGIFTVAAILLAAMGVYGVMAYVVSRRLPEIAVRVALGASSRDILRVVASRTLVLIAVGLTAGTAGAFAVTRLLGSLLWRVTASDPAAFVAALLLLGSVALTAAIVPLVRATALPPGAILRAE